MGEILDFKPDAAFLNTAGKRAVEEGDYGTAVTLLHKAVELCPDNTDYPIDLAMCYVAMDAVEEGRSILEEQFGLHRTMTGAAYMAYAHCFVDGSDFRVAIDLLRRIKDDEVSRLLPDAHEGPAFDLEFEDPPDIMLADDAESVGEQLRALVEDENLTGATKLLNGMDKQSINYPEALKAVAMICLAQDKRKKARQYLLKTLEIRPGDVFALTGLVLVDEDAARRAQYLTQLCGIEPNGYGELARICTAARIAGVTPESLKLIEAMYERFPMRKEVLEAMIKLYANAGLCDKAREIAFVARRLYPRDCVLTELHRMVADLQGVGELPLDDGLGADETERRIDALETWLERKGSIHAVEKGLQENAHMRETVRWLFQSDLYGVQANVGSFLAQSEAWQPFIRAQLLRDAPDGLKFEYIRALLFYARDKRYHLISGGRYYEYEPHLPLRACEAFLDAYYTAFAGLSVSQDDFEHKLDRLFKTTVRAFGGKTLEGKDDSDCIAAAMVYAMRCRKPYLTKTDITELFNIGSDELNEYTKLYFTTKKGGRKNA